MSLQPANLTTAAQINIIQNLTYFEHLSEPMAEFLHILAETYDYPQLTDEVLREISNKEFNSNDTRGPKSVSAFITKLSELAPRLVIKQMTMLAKQLDSEVIQSHMESATSNRMSSS
jgi:condensin complex subunit 1